MGTKQIQEVDYSLETIRAITPYLDDITYSQENGNIRHLTDKQRGYAWYYCFNNGVKSDAFRRAYDGRFSSKLNKIIFKNKIAEDTVGTRAYLTHKHVLVGQSIRLIRQEIERTIRENMNQTILEQLQIQASYDPGMFIYPNGTPKFKTWDDIPPAYRCCVEAITTSRYGKNGGIVETNIKLVNRATARAELLKIAPGLLQPTKSELLVKTLDEKGNEVGIDYSKLSDDQLRKMIEETEK